MSKNTKVTLNRGGTMEKTLPISQIVIPDLWDIAEAIKEHGKVPDRTAVGDAILKCWGIAQDLRQHILESPK